MDELSIGMIRPGLEGLRLSADLTTGDLLGLPDPLRRFIRWILEEGAVSCEQAAALLGATEKDARSLLYELAGHGLIEHVPTCGVPVFRVCLVPRRLRTPPELLELLKD